jgi:hypothetical protein
MHLNKVCVLWWLNRGDEESPAPPGSAPTISELDPDVDMDWQPAGPRTGGGVQSSDATREGHARPQGGKQESGEVSEGGPGEKSTLGSTLSPLLCCRMHRMKGAD